MTDFASSHFSINEIEQLCLKAARGAGLDWGLAEEAGQAAAWLVSQGIDGPEILLQRLTLGALAGPVLPWRAQRLLQCPISLGASLCDHAALPQTDLESQEIDLGPVAQPLLLAPFFSRMAALKRCAIALRGAGLQILLTTDARLVASAEPLRLTSQTNLWISKLAAPPPTTAGSVACRPSGQTMAALNSFALRTTVPASEASRAGAGASEAELD